MELGAREYRLLLPAPCSLLPAAMKLIVGLGNVGRKYEKTRHNVGFDVLDLVAAAQCRRTRAKEKFDGRIAGVTIGGERALLLWPHTLMNLSGQSVGAAVDFYQIAARPTCWWFATILTCRWASCGFAAKARPAGRTDWTTSSIGWGRRSSAGCESASARCPMTGTRPILCWASSDRPSARSIDEAIDRAAEAVECWVTEGIAVGMNRFN